MKCPRCGSEMTIDNHRKYPIPMCYECGYMEGRNMGAETKEKESNFSRMKKLNFNELVVFLAKGLDVSPERLADWLSSQS